jgi:hypothetical protein
MKDVTLDIKRFIDDILEFKELNICDFRVVTKNKIVKLYNKQIYHIYESYKFKELEIKYKHVFTMTGGYITIGNITYVRDYGSRNPNASIAVFNEFDSEDISKYIISKYIKES